MGDIKLVLAFGAKYFYVRDLSKDFHTQYGFIKAETLKDSKGGDIVETHTGKKLNVIEPCFYDIYAKMKRAPQIIPRKDIAYIIAETGIGKESKVLDAGTGSGALALMLANICKNVISYELRQDHHDVAKKNVDFFGFKNLKLKLRDITKKIDEKDVDLVTLDLPNPWDAVDNAKQALKFGGFIVSYSPTIPQVMDFVEKVKQHKELSFVKTVEIIEREWEIEQRKVRPKSRMIGHSGFLTFVRKM